MGIKLPDLIIESVLRDGLEYLRQKPETLDDVFSALLAPYNQRKYGVTELAKIKNLIENRNIAVVHSFAEAEAKQPCFSLQLMSESEAQGRAHLSDFEAEVQVPLTGSALTAATKITGLVGTSYSLKSGRITVADSVDLSLVGPGFIYVDGSGVEFQIQPGVSNVSGAKAFLIPKNSQPDFMSPGSIRTFLTYEQHERRGDSSQVEVMVGAHSVEPLVAKYLYIIAKYIFKSRKKDLIKRCFVNSSFRGSDFVRDTQYQGDQVYTRFLTIQGQVDDTWRSDDVELIDLIDLHATPVDDVD